MAEESLFEYGIVEVVAANNREDMVKFTPYPSSTRVKEAMKQVLSSLTTITWKLTDTLECGLPFSSGVSVSVLRLATPFTSLGHFIGSHPVQRLCHGCPAGY
jgi:hypothetical protein